MGKRVLLITRYFPPLDAIATLRMFSWAQRLRDTGHQVTVLTTSKKNQVIRPLPSDLSGIEVVEQEYFDPLTRFGGEKQKALAAARKGGWKSWALDFYRTRLNERIPGRTDGWLFPAYRQLSEWRKEGRSFDVVISSYGPPAAHLIGARAKRLFSAYWIADYRDLWVENATYTGVAPFTFLEKRLEMRFVSQADLITTISDPYRDFLKGKFPHIRCETLTNGYDQAAIDAVDGDRFSGKGAKFRLVYTGALYRKTRDPSPLFQAVRELINERKLGVDELELLFYGAVADALPELIERYSLQGVAYHMGAVAQGDAYALQKSANALLFLEDPAPKVPGVLTGKLFEYLYIGKPILAIGVGSESSAGELIIRAGAGLVCGQDVHRIKEALLSLISGKGVPARNSEVVEEFSRVRRADQLVGYVEGR